MKADKQSRVREKIFLVGLVLAVLTVTPYSVMDPMNLPKMTIVGILSFSLLGASVNTQFIQKVRQQKALTALIGFFIFNGLLVLFFSGRTINEGLYGISGRNTGFLTYLSFSIVLLVTAQLSSFEFIQKFILVFTAIGLILSIYGVIQHVGLEPFPYINIYENNVFGTFGNPNFQSAFMGIFSALIFSLVLDDREGIPKRLLCLFLVVFGLYGIFITNSWQGFFNFAAGAGIAITLNLFRLGKEKLGLIFLAILGSFGILVAFGLFNQGPFASSLAKASLSARRLYWEAAIRMLNENPIFGIGWDGFGDWFRRSRSADAVKFNPGLVSDSAHSVPLDIASGGGYSLLVLYMAFIVLGIFSIVKVVRTKRFLSVNYIALVAAWVSYQAQSLISINQIGLGIIGWSLNGLVIGYAHSESIEKKISEMQLSKVKTKNQGRNFSSISLFGSMVGLVIGSLVSIPPYISANRYYEGVKTSDARVINSNAYLKPLDLRRMVHAAGILERNKFFKQAHQISVAATTNFPDSFAAWTLLLSLTNSTEADKAKANSELLRLDPSRSP